MRNHRRGGALVAILLAMVLGWGCASEEANTAALPAPPPHSNAVAPEQAGAPDRAAEGDSAQGPQKLGASHLPNAYRLHPRVISGGQPDGEKAFEELAALGVKTIISVDGATPEVALARKHGLRYVHLPHGYDGIPPDRIEQLAKAVRDLPGPIYLHCHHGKHRSPAAASVACVGAGLIEPGQAVGVLRAAGTNEGYRGLYGAAESAKRIDDAVLNALAADYPEVAKIPPFAEAMVALEQTHDHVKAIAAAGWKSPPHHPDLAPPHEALLLREHFTEMLRSATAQREPEAFGQMLKESEAAAQQLEELLKEGGEAQDRVAQANAALDRINRQCAACHKQFRDVPLSEKQR